MLRTRIYFKVQEINNNFFQIQKNIICICFYPIIVPIYDEILKIFFYTYLYNVVVSLMIFLKSLFVLKQE